MRAIFQKPQIGRQQRRQVDVGVIAGHHRRKRIVQQVQRRPIHMNDQGIEVVEQVVERTHGIADIIRDTARRKG